MRLVILRLTQCAWMGAIVAYFVLSLSGMTDEARSAYGLMWFFAGAQIGVLVYGNWSE